LIKTGFKVYNLDNDAIVNYVNDMPNSGANNYENVKITGNLFNVTAY
jgi:hypothetical protein